MIDKKVKPFRFHTAIDGTRHIIIENGKINTVYKKNGNPNETFRRYSLLSKISLKLKNMNVVEVLFKLSNSNVIDGRPHDSIFE